MPDAARNLLEMVDADVAGFRNPRATVLEQVQWRVQPEDFWVIAGLHRSGKTDLLATASGIVPPRQGVCRLFGHDTRQRNETNLSAARLGLGLVFDGGQLLQGLTVRENVALPYRYHRNLSLKQAMPRVEPLLKLMELESWAHAYPELMGRNWQQRAGLARALVLEPELLLLDNPLSGLDPRDLAWWVRILRELAKGHSVLDNKPITIVVAGDSFLPWRDYPHRSAILRNRRFRVLDQQPSGEAPDQSLLQAGIY